MNADSNRLFVLLSLVVLAVSFQAAVVRAQRTVYGVPARTTVVVAPAPRPVVVVPAPRPVVVAPAPAVAGIALPSGYIAVLPTGYRVVTVSGSRYYLAGGIHYRATFYQGRTCYVRVRL